MSRSIRSSSGLSSQLPDSPVNSQTPRSTPRLPGQIPGPPAQTSLSSCTNPTYSMPLVGFQTVPICHTIAPVTSHCPAQPIAPTPALNYLHDVCINAVMWLCNTQPLIV